MLQRGLRKGFIKMITSFPKQSWTYKGELMRLQHEESTVIKVLSLFKSTKALKNSGQINQTI